MSLANTIVMLVRMLLGLHETRLIINFLEYLQSDRFITILRRCFMCLSTPAIVVVRDDKIRSTLPPESIPKKRAVDPLGKPNQSRFGIADHSSGAERTSTAVS